MTRLLILLLALAPFAQAADTITVPMRRTGPRDGLRQLGLTPYEEKTIPLTVVGCEGKARLRALRYQMKFRTEGPQVAIDASADADMEKAASGPMTPPSLTIASKGESLTFVFEKSMASTNWEKGGTFRESFTSRDLYDARFWDSATFRCSAEPPAHTAAVKKVEEALRGERFGAAALYGGEMVIIGPGLHAKVKDDPALKSVASPVMISIDPRTGAARSMLRIKGAAETVAFGAAMRRYLGDATPRVRAATTAEHARFRLNFGWEIDEPLLVADYGAHRIVLVFEPDGQVSWVDELYEE